MSSPEPRSSVRTELLASIGILAGAAVLVAVLGVMILPVSLDTRAGALYVGALLAADVGVFVAFGAFQLRRLLTGPLAAAVAATEAIAAGDLSRRLPSSATREFDALSTSVNRMTDNLLREQSYRIRAEKLASVGRLAAGIAHEVGNPLGAIDGYAHILRNRVGGGRGPSRDERGSQAVDPAVRDALDGIARESARIDRIVRGLLDYARPRRATPARLDLNDVVRSAISLLTEQGALRGVVLDASLDSTAPLALHAQRHELEQLFVNLLLNAVDAIDAAVAVNAHGAGEGDRRVAVRTRRTRAAELVAPPARRAGDPSDLVAVPRRSSSRVHAWLERAGQMAGGTGDVVHVVVADSGTGVPDDDAERIFDPFYTTKEPGKGTGLGLAIVARVVESLGGVVWVQRAREGGAAFVLVLPLACADDSASPPSAAQEPRTEADAARRAPRRAAPVMTTDHGSRGHAAATIA